MLKALTTKGCLFSKGALLKLLLLWVALSEVVFLEGGAFTANTVSYHVLLATFVTM